MAINPDMKMIVVEHFEEMSQVSSEIVLDVMHQNGRADPF